MRDAPLLLSQVKAALLGEVARCETSIRALRAKLARLSPQAPGEIAPKARSRDGWTPAKREEVSRRMRAFWAARRGRGGAEHDGEGAPS